MGAGSYVGRVGGLAVAFGIGAAVLTGAGAAYADDGAGGDSAGTSASSSAQGPASADRTKPVKVKTAKTETAKPDRAESDKSESETAESDNASKADAESADPAGKDRNRPADDTGGSDDASGADDDASDEGEAPAAEVTEHQAGEEEQPAAPEQPVAEEQPPAAVEPSDAEVQAPVETTTTESTVTKALAATDGLATGEPAADSGEPVVPALTSLVMSLVAAGREVTDEAPRTVADQVGTALTAAAAEGYPIPTDVTVEEWTPPLEWLQRIPVLGPLLVTPLVGLAHVIPFVGDVIHPVIGFPIDHTAPPGTPRPRSFRVTSFDGTRIFVNFMPAKGLKAGETAPTVLNGPGLGLPGSSTLELDVDSFLPNDVIGIGALREAGYNVVTWDPRGEWRSEGIMHLNSPDLEGRDMSHIISYLATLPEVALDAVNDPRIGMTGASYGGGIQLAAAAIDHRIDAIVPTIAWNNLTDVLFPRSAVNSGWGTILPAVLALTFAREHPRIFPVAIAGVLFGYASQDDLDLVDTFSYADQLKDITAPTLVIQGTVDTLFTLDQAHLNALALIEAGTTTKVIWYCGGHGACLSDFNDGELVIDRTLSWLDRYVKGNENVETGPQFEWVDQNGVWYGDEQYPTTPGTPVVAERTERRTLAYIPALFGSGPNPLIITRGLVAALLGLPSAAAAANSVNLRVPDVTELTHVVGAPELTLTYSGEGTAEHVYAQIVDDETGLVLGNHATPIPVVLDGESHTVTFSLEQVAHTLKPGQSVTVQIVTSTAKYLNFYSWGAITVQAMSISLPTRAAAAAAQQRVNAA
ncbi:X-Pro dipeptidyl-peptidase (S15 family) [Mycolicibacterium aurum]|uniref:X-Pro dipeptidyl-peptidase (S15 family) n=1 Tax=Mycolicibacterium aurum TaxID=1791 RepID=A0A448IH08_MYCAU|nr:CocE/NonD family hydrolase [Mycolicibacterium aurum]VEG51720.1 X-Pro dipeptidyl-peptidase (S15 family) [Mycolicibacterium aurum]